MRRIILLLAMVATVAVMLLALAGGPALAVNNNTGCKGVVINPNAIQKVREAATKPLGSCQDVEPVITPPREEPP